jgi:ABC-2 type transport system ATP-binding protein
MTLLVSSHILAELDEYSDDMLVLRGGRLVAHSPIGSQAVTTAVASLRLQLAAPCTGLAELLAAAGGTEVVVSDRVATFGFSGDDFARHRLLRHLIEAGAEVCALAEERQNLQQAYLDSVRSAGQGRGL